jgi:hypothetical protein
MPNIFDFINSMFHNPISRKEAIKRSLLLLGAGYGLGSIGFLGESCHSGTKGNFTYKIDSDQEKIIAEIAEIFIPKTETPGAKDIGLEKFIISFVKDCYGSDVQESFVRGLKDFSEKVKGEFKTDFWKLSFENKVKLVKEEDANSFTLMSTVKRKVMKSAPNFFQIMKELSVLGYCTSEVGATEALAFLPVPGHYAACIPLSPGQKAWAISK